jgi:hypothetical protein
LAQQSDTRWQRWRCPEARSVLINARAPMNYAVMAPVYKAMQSDPRVKFYFTISRGASRAEDVYREAGDKIQVIRPARAMLMKFDAYLAADFIWATLPRGARRIQMFHGVAGKYSNVYDTPERSMREWDRLFFINQRRLRNFIKAGAIDEGSQAARLVGMPKVDCLVDGSLTRDGVLERLGIDPGRRTVLYAPTWSPYCSLKTMGEELISGLVSAGYAVIVKLHDRSHDPEYAHSGGTDWVARLGPLVRASGGHMATGSNSCPYMMAADVLITDHSSVGFEYLLLDRPIVRIEVSALLEQANVNPDYVRLLSEASTGVRDAVQAIAAVERSFAEPMRQSAARKAIASELFHNPGRATSRAVRELYEVLELDRPEAAQSPAPVAPRALS